MPLVLMENNREPTVTSVVYNYYQAARGYFTCRTVSGGRHLQSELLLEPISRSSCVTSLAAMSVIQEIKRRIVPTTVQAKLDWRLV
ncbi:hypothetical protein RRG08_034272 [Elysia crispata]|uniref:Uncharacterized protein n=1 Tax=Elysia crispata TaxID=231223 RepID=A0AAE1A0I1_9GAST|nr:hypothetical protein RRG08_034272 [Elysia crispata]